MEEPCFVTYYLGSLNEQEDVFCTDDSFTYKLVRYRGDNRCVKCAFAYDEKQCMANNCEFPNGEKGYWRYFRGFCQEYQQITLLST